MIKIKRHENEEIKTKVFSVIIDNVIYKVEEHYCDHKKIDRIITKVITEEEKLIINKEIDKYNIDYNCVHISDELLNSSRICFIKNVTSNWSDAAEYKLKELKFKGYIIVDYLLHNGPDDRFYCLYFNGKTFDNYDKNISPFDIINENFINDYCNKYLYDNIDLLDCGILHSGQINMFKKYNNFIEK